MNKKGKNIGFCCFCGGSHPRHNNDHVPPKTLFLQKHRPKGLEFASCRACNAGSSASDVAISFISRLIGSATNSQIRVENDPQFSNVRASFMANYPDIARDMAESLVDEPFLHKEIWRNGLAAEIPPGVHPLVRHYFAKQSVALYFEHTGNIAPLGATITVSWFSNSPVEGQDAILNMTSRFAEGHDLCQGKWQVKHQFSYRYYLDDAANAGFAITLHESMVGVCTLLSVGEENRRSENVYRVTSIGIMPTSFPMVEMSAGLR